MTPIKIGALIGFLWLLSGCATVEPTYKFTPNSPSDPQITFKSEFELYTFFSVNTKHPALNACSDFEDVGFVLNKKSMFLLDKPIKEINIAASADNPISISAYVSFYNGNYREHCGPLTRIFTPESKGKYVVTFKRTGDFCSLAVESVDISGGLKEIDAMPLPKCNKDVVGNSDS